MAGEKAASARALRPVEAEEAAPRSARIIVHFDDGTSATLNPNRPRLLMDMEKRWGVQEPETHTQIAWLAHHAVGGEEDFDSWVDRVEEFETVLPKSSPDGEAPKDPS